MKRLADRTAVVTGGGSGIGEAICRAFASEGAIVAVTDLRLSAAEEVAAAICREVEAPAEPAQRRLRPPARAWLLDVGDGPAVEAAAVEIENALGPIDIWVNNAGVSYICPFLDCSDQLWDKTLRINLTGAFNGCRAAIRRMAPRGRGVILNMSSQSGKQGNSQYAAYCASKFGVIGLTQSLAMEFAPVGIRVNALCPGVVFTPLWDQMLDDYARKRSLRPEEVKPYLESKIPLGRLCTPEDVANAAVFLASDEAAYMTGQAINLAGGSIM
jgi:NAD(P)-dependent dehydrogenase (short-subunit alcohol dehydrogenase family)